MDLLTFVMKAQRKFFSSTLGKLFYQQRLDKNGNIILPRKFFS